MTTTDIDELERILIESDELGTNEDYENAYGEQKGPQSTHKKFVWNGAKRGDAGV